MPEYKYALCVKKPISDGFFVLFGNFTETVSTF